MRARRSTLILAGSWLAVFVLYLFVKPDGVTPQRPQPTPAVPVVQQLPVPMAPGK